MCVNLVDSSSKRASERMSTSLNTPYTSVFVPSITASTDVHVVDAGGAGGREHRRLEEDLVALGVELGVHGVEGDRRVVGRAAIAASR